MYISIYADTQTGQKGLRAKKMRMGIHKRTRCTPEGQGRRKSIGLKNTRIFINNNGTFAGSHDGKFSILYPFLLFFFLRQVRRRLSNMNYTDWISGGRTRNIANDLRTGTQIFFKEICSKGYFFPIISSG